MTSHQKLDRRYITSWAKTQCYGIKRYKKYKFTKSNLTLFWLRWLILMLNVKIFRWSVGSFGYFIKYKSTCISKTRHVGTSLFFVVKLVKSTQKVQINSKNFNIVVIFPYPIETKQFSLCLKPKRLNLDTILASYCTDVENEVEFTLS